MNIPSDDEMRVMVAKICGVSPKRKWRVFYDKERQHASIGIHSKQEAIEVRYNSTSFWESCGFDPAAFSEPEEYDDWMDAPDYPEDLNACAEFEEELPSHLWSSYTFELRKVIQRECDSEAYYVPGTERSRLIADFWFYRASARQRCVAFLMTKGEIK